MMKFIIYLCFLLSGVSGLIYQIVWSKYFILFIGATTYAHAVTLFTFMGGLALGNYLFGHVADWNIRKLKLYAILETGIGISCLLFPDLFNLFSNIYINLAKGNLPNTFSILILKLFLCVFSILLPTTLMGGTIPVMSKFLVKYMKELGSRVGFLYFFNTAGAAIGCIIGGFFIIQNLGLEFSIQATSILNIFIGFIIFYLSKYKTEKTETPQIQEESSVRSYTEFQRKIVLISIGVSGIASMFYELVWTRFLALVVGSATQSFSIMLLTFISGIAIGSFIVANLFKEDRNAFKLFAIVEILIFLSLLMIFPVYERLPYYFYYLSGIIPRKEEFFFLYEFIQVIICFFAMLIPTILIGMTLPLASRVNTKAISKVGEGVGNTFSFNTLGNIIGSVVAGFLLIPFLGLEKTLELGMTINFLIGGFIFAYGGKRKYTLPVLIIGLIIIITLFSSPNLDKVILQGGMYRSKSFNIKSFEKFKNIFKETELLYYKDGSSSTVSVTREKKSLRLKINGKTDASSHGDMITQALLSHIPLFLHKNPEQVFILGLGSGVTGHSATTHREVKSIEIAEISPEVIEALKFFKDVNNNVEKNNKVKILNVDAREYLKLNPQKIFDVIISEPSNPWMAGIGNLFTKEFFTEVSTHLKQGGLMTQWIHIYEMDDNILSIIFNSFGSVFKYVTVWSVPSNNDILLLGSQQPITINFSKIESKFNNPDILMDLTRKEMDVKVRDIVSFLSMQILSDFRFKFLFSNDDLSLINEDNFPVVEYKAPKAFFVGKTSQILSEIDERKLPQCRSNLYLKEFLEKNPLTVEKGMEILSEISKNISMIDTNIVSALLHFLYDKGQINSIIQFKEYINTSLIGADTIYNSLFKTPLFTKQDCNSYLQVKKHLTGVKASIFYTPDIKDIEEIYNNCGRKFPDGIIEFDILMAEIYKVSGYIENEIIILNNIINSGKLNQNALFKTKKEKAKALLHSGKFREARQIFEELKDSQDREVRFYLSRINRG